MSAPVALRESKNALLGSSAGRSERYDLIEAARGVAVLMVVLFHSLTAYPPGTLTPALATLGRITEHGWLGVHVFFAISGWCIAERLALARRQNESAGRFLFDRCLRIFPAYWVAIAIVVGLRLAAAGFNSTDFASNLPADWRSWVGTLLLLDPYLDTSAYLTVSWSLVYELGFYACTAIALLFSCVPKVSGRLIFSAGALACALPWILAPDALPWFVLGLWPHFFAGVAAWYAVRRRERALGFGALAALIVAASAWPGSDSPGLIAALATAAALALLHPYDRRLSGTTGIRLLLRLGAISYSVYLIHVPFLSAGQNLAKRAVSPSDALFIAVWLTSVLLALAVGWALGTRVELPLQRWRKHRRAAAPS